MATDDSCGAPLSLIIRDLTSLDDYEQCLQLQDATWGAGFSERVPAAILRVGQLIGGVSAGAFDGNAMVGFVFGLTGVRDGQLVHWSDMLAVRASHRGRHLGERLKHYQRDKVRALGVGVMLWTYDPLVARNAYFNICRLGARPIDYVPNMYGANTGSALHGPLPTDRFIVRWDLDQPPHGAALPDETTRPTLPTLPLANPLGPDDTPTIAAVVPAPVVLVQIPADLEHERAGAERAMAWRMNVRDVVGRLLAGGYRVTGFTRARADRLPAYVFARDEAAGAAP